MVWWKFFVISLLEIINITRNESALIDKWLRFVIEAKEQSDDKKSTLTKIKKIDENSEKRLESLSHSLWVEVKRHISFFVCPFYRLGEN